MNSSLLVEMKNLQNFKIAESPLNDQLSDGEVMLEVARFSLTSNNVTYGAMGEAFGYWKFFPVDDTWGRIPVWGFANVKASQCNGIEVGEKVYGFMPMSDCFKVVPGNIKAQAWTDHSEHRSQLPAVYNHYVRAKEDPLYHRDFEKERVVFGPLFSTAFVLAHALENASCYDAEQVIMTSASSKTAIATAYILRKLLSPKLSVVALTSQRNLDFVQRLPFFTSSLTYEDVQKLPARTSVLLDFSGDRSVIAPVHQKLSDKLVKSIAIGATHWNALDGIDADLETAGRGLPGTQPKMFHAPTEIFNKHKEWGPLEYGRRQGEMWQQFVTNSREWFALEEAKGLEGAAEILADLINGSSKANTGYTIALR